MLANARAVSIRALKPELVGVVMILAPSGKNRFCSVLFFCLTESRLLFSTAQEDPRCASRDRSEAILPQVLVANCRLLTVAFQVGSLRIL
jgi:hypothetical protein